VTDFGGYRLETGMCLRVLIFRYGDTVWRLKVKGLAIGYSRPGDSCRLALDV
jgi:hypothetical protein